MTDNLINAKQAAPLTNRAYPVALRHIMRDYDRLQAGKAALVFHTVVKIEGGRPKWWVSEADAIAFGAMTLENGVDARANMDKQAANE